MDAPLQYCSKILGNRAKSFIKIYSVFCQIDKGLRVASSSSLDSDTNIKRPRRLGNGLNSWLFIYCGDITIFAESIYVLFDTPLID